MKPSTPQPMKSEIVKTPISPGQASNKYASGRLTALGIAYVATVDHIGHVDTNRFFSACAVANQFGINHRNHTYEEVCALIGAAVVSAAESLTDDSVRCLNRYFPERGVL